MRNLTIAHWNVLNDAWFPKSPKQIDRLNDIIEAIQKLKKEKKHLLLFVCELMPDNLPEITKRTGLIAIGKPEPYRRLKTVLPRSYGHQAGIFLADAETAKHATVVRSKIYKNRNDLLLVLRIKGHSILGCHMPSRGFYNARSRFRHTNRILKLKPDIVMGDFNATPQFWMRQRLFNAGYREVHHDGRPPFPTPSFRGKNIPIWWPKMNIDAIYHQPTLLPTNPGYAITEGSDHPLIWADFTVQ